MRNTFMYVTVLPLMQVRKAYSAESRAIADQAARRAGEYSQCAIGHAGGARDTVQRIEEGG